MYHAQGISQFYTSPERPHNHLALGFPNFAIINSELGSLPKLWINEPIFLLLCVKTQNWLIKQFDF